MKPRRTWAKPRIYLRELRKKNKTRQWYYCRNLKLNYGTMRQFISKQRFTVLTQNQRTHAQRLSPENKGRGLTLYTLTSRLQKQKAKLNPLVAACDFIGQFIFLVLCDLHVSIL
jgi:hypothetical protein